VVVAPASGSRSTSTPPWRALDEEDLPLDEDEAECFAARFVSIIGVDALEDAGIEPEDFGDEDFDLNEADLEFDEDQGRELADGFGECGVSMAELLVASIEGEGTELSDDARDCLEENIDEDAFGEFFAQAFADPEAFEDEPPEEFVSMFFQLAADCPELVESSG
jgi:hypothetical protein